VVASRHSGNSELLFNTARGGKTRLLLLWRPQGRFTVEMTIPGDGESRCTIETMNLVMA
jgi:hypothetical protein